VDNEEPAKATLIRTQSGGGPTAVKACISASVGPSGRRCCGRRWRWWMCFYNSGDSVMGEMGVVIAWSYGICALLIIGYYSNTAVEEAVKNRLNR